MWTKKPKTKFASSFFSVLKYSNLNSKNSKINQKKYLSSSIDKSIPTITKLTKTMLNNKKTKDPHTENNTIDINISVNYHKNANLLRNNHEHISSSLYKAPMKKITSYSMNPSAHKRNSSDASDSNIIQNNLNISLTNIASPKNNNSFIVNPIFFNKTIDEERKKNKVSSAKNLKEYMMNNSIKNDSIVYNKEIIKVLDGDKKINALIKNVNEKMKDCSHEKDINRYNKKKFEIIQNAMSQFTRYIGDKEKEFIVMIAKYYKEIIECKDEQINDFLKSKIYLLII